MSIEEQIKAAELAKILADTEKIKKETQDIPKNKALTFWSEIVKIVAGIVLGVGGVFIALTQYDAAETRAKYAKDKLDAAEVRLATTTILAKTAKSEEIAAIAAKDQALEAKRAAEEYVKNLKVVVEERTAKAEEAKPNSIKSRLVYVQFQGAISREFINELRGNLTRAGYTAPGAERVAGNYRPIVKYFSVSDKVAAETLAKEVEKFFSERNCPIELSAELTKSATPSQTLELWIPHKCQ